MGRIAKKSTVMKIFESNDNLLAIAFTCPRYLKIFDFSRPPLASAAACLESFPPPPLSYVICIFSVNPLPTQTYRLTSGYRDFGILGDRDGIGDGKLIYRNFRVGTGTG